MFDNLEARFAFACELSVGRRFTYNSKSYLFLKGSFIFFKNFI